MPTPSIVGFGGTTRAGSTSEKLVRAVLAECETRGARTMLFGGRELAALPHFAPEDTARTAEQRFFVEAVRASQGIVIGTPGYHGGLSGLVKNAIDLLEDLRTDSRVYFSGRPVGLIVSAAGGPGASTAMTGLRDIVHAMRGWPTPFGLTVNPAFQNPFSSDGVLQDRKLELAIKVVADELMQFVQIRGDQ